jgi:hypothetical protein
MTSIDTCLPKPVIAAAIRNRGLYPSQHARGIPEPVRAVLDYTSLASRQSSRPSWLPTPRAVLCFKGLFPVASSLNPEITLAATSCKQPL